MDQVRDQELGLVPGQGLDQVLDPVLARVLPLRLDQVRVLPGPVQAPKLVHMLDQVPVQVQVQVEGHLEQALKQVHMLDRMPVPVLVLEAGHLRQALKQVLMLVLMPGPGMVLELDQKPARVLAPMQVPGQVQDLVTTIKETMVWKLHVLEVAT